MTDRRLYLRQWILAMDRYELRLRYKVASARNAFIKVMAKQYASTGSIANHLRTKHEQRLGEILLAHYQDVMPFFGGFATKPIKARHGYVERKAVRTTFHALLMEWASTRALENASSIADTNMNDVRRKIEAGLEDGLGNEEIGREIRKVTQDTPYRAATIARTETHAAATYGAIQEARQISEELGMELVKEWLPTLDDRTRPEHAALLNMEPIGLDEKFDVGGEMLDRPGDPSGSPENIINCRCAILTTEKE